MAQRVTIGFEGGVADVRLNRPDKMNALDPAMFEGIAAAIADLGAMKSLRAVVLSGEGRAFCAGLDMASMASGGASAGKDLRDRTHGAANLFQHVAWGWRELKVPVVAAVHGIAFGGGFQIMSGADIRIVHSATRLSIMEMKWGLVPDMAGVALWRTLVRDDVLRELTYTAREFTGEDAVRLGFATRIADDPHAQAMALAREIAARNPDAVQASKRLYNAYSNDAEALLMAESIEQAGVIRTPNQIEAVRANVEKRAPVFRDRP
ncbi:crotonase/enoyl-CoA hydratase family protein [Sphingomonas sp. MAH-20]|uniref:Crotonase/enoyl-CoA hydratase family protein n=1 Tax=Sphingomonas horti TaxID=2682842 RepID=A0A6I4J4S2_9SPHN|nr:MULTISPECIES: crotonase/enoyl-CoA hydratase family protein [Sphingomonas]MBA2921115.1 crotonase/enoyl-CoA hydratase family protein [Sphingomonas sp. CGMCC 1.13658]MVO79357.1 crotonase/enoyl-CoA hydratase family protein [Sphingomonas horti]